MLISTIRCITKVVQFRDSVVLFFLIYASSIIQEMLMSPAVLEMADLEAFFNGLVTMATQQLSTCELLCEARFVHIAFNLRRSIKTCK